MITARANVFAAMRLWVAQLVAFSALGWLVAGILDAAGTFPLSDALVVCGLVMGVITGLVAFQGVDRPLIRAGRITAMDMTGLTDRLGPDIPRSAARALAVLSAGVAAAGLVAAGAILG